MSVSLDGHLDGQWQFRIAGPLRGPAPADIVLNEWMAATVPGTVHHQLELIGKIPDPWFARNELQLQWIDEQDWEWRRTFKADAADCARARQELVFDGLDTVCTIFLNGHEIGRSVNMFRQVVCDIRGKIQVGENELRILFQSPTRFAKDEAERGGNRIPFGDFRWQTGEVRPTGRAWIRKTQCHFGWDWGVYLATSGIWQPVRLECTDSPRCASVVLEQEHIGPAAEPTEVRLHVKVALAAPAAIGGILRIDCDGQHVESKVTIAAGEHAVEATIVLNRPRLWWPSGIGEPHLYRLDIAWMDANGTRALATRRIGVRSIELVRDADTSPDGKPAETFYFRVNGRPVFAKGANWIPADQFIERCTPEVYRHLLSSMVEANMNMVRVWGGGWYEQDIFYDLCDELGLMVWQDFMMACALYPNTPRFIQEMTAEARYQVRRLHTHPSIAIWCGDNENITAVWEWWKAQAEFASNVATYQDVMSALRQAVEAEERTRTFWLSSPSNNSFGENTNDPTRGDVHFWNVWHQHEPFSSYLKIKPRFASEFGFQSFPEPRTIRAVVPPEELNPSSRTMEHHQRTPDGNMILTHSMVREMRLAKDFDSFCWVSQINQANAIRTAVEHWRRLRPWCMGTLFWQLNDLWPVASWSAIDYHGRWKALQHFATRFYAPVLASLVHQDGKLQAWATSDLAQPLDLKGEVELFTWDGARVAHRTIAGKLQAGESRMLAEFAVGDLLQGTVEPHEVCAFIQVQGSEVSANNYTTLLPWKWISLPPPQITAALKQGDDQLELHVHSEQVIPFFHAELPGFEGHFQGDWQVLRPGARYILPWMPHVNRGAAAPMIEKAETCLTFFSLFDTYSTEPAARRTAKHRPGRTPQTF